MKEITVFVGNFGSGKSELAINNAINAALAKKRSVLCDLDLINPYFRASERERELTEAGAALITPNYAMSGAEAPTLPPDVYSIFSDKYDSVTIDAGGDAMGATVLGQYKKYFDEEKRVKVYFVVNACRPLAATPNEILALLENTQACGRIKVTGLINNTNLANETTVQELAHGLAVLTEVSNRSGIPVAYTAGTTDILDEFFGEVDRLPFKKKHIGKRLDIVRYMHRDWDAFTEKGI